MRMIPTSSDFGYGSDMRNEQQPDWEEVLSSAARLQEIIPGAVLVGGTASALFADHRFSRDADHILADLTERFDSILADLESVAGWKTARVKRPVMILGSLDGIETGIRQLIRTAPLETIQIKREGKALTVPSEGEILRIKGVLILKRNATRDYLDFAALAKHLGFEKFRAALLGFDNLYPQPNGESALQQLQIQLAEPLPYDLEESQLIEYKNLREDLADWSKVRQLCIGLSLDMFSFIEGARKA
ncbi:MAG: hypothetical protein ACOYM2_17700 [Rectinemataceae bacterium]